MPKKVSTTVYTFQELLALGKEFSKVREKARCKLQEYNATGDSIGEGLDLDWKPALEQIGFMKPEILWTGFSCQGDGASFTAKIDMEKMLWFMTHHIEAKNCVEHTERTGKDKEDFLPWVSHKLNNNRYAEQRFERLEEHLDKIYEAQISRIQSSGRYVHWNTCVTEIETLDVPHDIAVLFIDFEKAVEELRKDLCKAIYADLETHNNYLMSDEALIEFNDDNGWMWDVNGRMYDEEEMDTDNEDVTITQGEI